MRIIKWFILILISITKIYCSPYNHLDIQLALLILSAGDHDGNIVKDANLEFMKINISKDPSNKVEKDIIDIIPSLREIRKHENDIERQNQRIEIKFKELYKKAEKLAIHRLGLTIESTLFDAFRTETNNNNVNNNNNADNNNELVKTHFENLDVFRKLNTDGIGLINGENDMT
ncbi:hypothetical protein BCR36DRAFT_156730, partial [Piromyces finnis]